jgi:transposase
MNLAALRETSVAKAMLFVSLELGNAKWHVVAGEGGPRISEYTVKAGDGAGLLAVIAKARVRFGLGADAAVMSCYEAGRDGFWVHRFLEASGVKNLVVDSASIEVKRRQRRAKTDRIDARKLQSMLVRHASGEKDVWKIVRVPSKAEEDARRPHRERERLVKERSAHVARIKSLLVMHNLRPKVGPKNWLSKLARIVLPQRLREEIEREAERLALTDKQIAQLEAEQKQFVAEHTTEAGAVKQKQLQKLRSIGAISAWVLVRELFAWRSFANRRQVAGSAGLGSSPYSSGDLERDQGISKAGNRRVRTLMIELAWSWLRHQPASALARWFAERYGKGSGRSRRIGIVALARRLLIALWRYVEHGVIPDSAKLKAA